MQEAELICPQLQSGAWKCHSICTHGYEFFLFINSFLYDKSAPLIECLISDCCNKLFCFLFFGSVFLPVMIQLYIAGLPSMYWDTF